MIFLLSPIPTIRVTTKILPFLLGFATNPKHYINPSQELLLDESHRVAEGFFQLERRQRSLKTILFLGMKLDVNVI